MDIKNNKGITLIALIITILIIVIIAGIIIYDSSKLIDDAIYADVKTNMLLVQAEMKNYIEQAKFENKTIQDILSNGIELDGKTLNIKVPDNSSLVTVEGKNLYQINSNMANLKLGNIDPTEYLIVIETEDNKVTGKIDVYYVPGFESSDNGVIHFLSRME